MPTSARTVGELMSKDVVTAGLHASLESVAETMTDRRISCVVIVDQNIPVAMVSERDMVRLSLWCCRRLNSRAENAKRVPKVQDFVTSTIHTVPEDTSVERALETMKTGGFRRLPIVDADGGLVGLVTQTDIVEALKGELENRRLLEELRTAHEQLNREVSERKRVESALIQAQKLKAIGQLAAGIAHEINTPIQYIGDNAFFLHNAFGRFCQTIDACVDVAASTQKGLPPEKASDALTELTTDRKTQFLRQEIPGALKHIQEGVDRVAAVVGAMRDFSHPGPRHLEPADINRALRASITVAQNEWKYACEVETELDQRLPMVPCFLGELNQAFLNMIVNASHAIQEKRGTAPREKGTIRVRTSFDPDWATVTIADDGIGIPADHLAEVFNPFFTTKSVGDGTGQGLSLAHAVIDRHGGSIEVDSEPGRGTTFSVRLPLHPQETEETSHETHPVC